MDEQKHIAGIGEAKKSDQSKASQSDKVNEIFSKIGFILNEGGLFEVISEKDGKPILVKNLESNVVRPIFLRDVFVYLSSIKVDQKEHKQIPLLDVLIKMYEYLKGQEYSYNSKESNSSFFSFFKEVLPDYDSDVVAASHIKKVIKYYNILVRCGKLHDIVRALKTETHVGGDVQEGASQSVSSKDESLEEGGTQQMFSEGKVGGEASSDSQVEKSQE